MAESKLRELSMEFSVDIINLVKYLKEKRESIISNQIGRSGTSIGANIVRPNVSAKSIINAPKPMLSQFVLFSLIVSLFFSYNAAFLVIVIFLYFSY